MSTASTLCGEFGARMATNITMDVTQVNEPAPKQAICSFCQKIDVMEKLHSFGTKKGKTVFFHRDYECPEPRDTENNEEQVESSYMDSQQAQNIKKKDRSLQKECLICQTHDSTEKLVELPCGHIFHPEDLVTYWTQQKEGTAEEREEDANREAHCRVRKINELWGQVRAGTKTIEEIESEGYKDGNYVKYIAKFLKATVLPPETNGTTNTFLERAKSRVQKRLFREELKARIYRPRCPYCTQENTHVTRQCKHGHENVIRVVSDYKFEFEELEKVRPCVRCWAAAPPIHVFLRNTIIENDNLNDIQDYDNRLDGVRSISELPGGSLLVETNDNMTRGKLARLAGTMMNRDRSVIKRLAWQPGPVLSKQQGYEDGLLIGANDYWVLLVRRILRYTKNREWALENGHDAGHYIQLSLEQMEFLLMKAFDQMWQHIQTYQESQKESKNRVKRKNITSDQGMYLVKRRRIASN